MPRTFTIRHELYIRVEADSQGEAMREAAEIATSIRPVLPTGATLSTSRVIQRQGA